MKNARLSRKSEGGVMTKTIKGKYSAKGKRFAIVVSRFNEMITNRLLEGALDCIRRHGGEEKNIEIILVPGSFELPGVAFQIAKSGKYHAVVCLAAVIRGGRSILNISPQRSPRESPRYPCRAVFLRSMGFSHVIRWKKLWKGPAQSRETKDGRLLSALLKWQT
jgi:hypothetical protein